MKLEVGKSYRSREGKKVTITTFTKGDLWPFHEERKEGCTPRSFRGDGTYGINPGQDAHYDLVALWEDKVLKLEIGKRYRSRAGEIFKIKAHHVDGTYIGMSIADINRSWAYHEDGVFWMNAPENEHTLVEEVTEDGEVKIPNLKLEVGKQYRSRSGLIFTIFQENKNNGGVDGQYGFRGKAGDIEYNFDANGSFSPRGHDNQYTLIEEVGGSTSSTAPSVIYKKKNESYPYGGWERVIVA